MSGRKQSLRGNTADYAMLESQNVSNHFSKCKPSGSTAAALLSEMRVGKFYDLGAEFHLPLESIEKHVGNTDIGRILEQVPSLPCDDIVSSVSAMTVKKSGRLVFTVNRDVFIKSTLEDPVSTKPSRSNGRSILFDFSSPNIAKPFHVGHLRSTVIGNFLSNIYEWLGYDVVRLNYFGDWGTQFGLIKIGMSLLNPSSDEIAEKPLHTLSQAYVLANKSAENNPNILVRAREIFCSLEMGKNDDFGDWELYKKHTILELEKTYLRLGVKFTDYDWESNYRAKNLTSLIETLHLKGLLSVDAIGRTVCCLQNGETVPLLKSDGTTLYLTRDVAAACHRYKKFKFDEMFYVVDSSQTNHFRKLFNILHGMDAPFAGSLRHVGFGRVRGMSTRKGESVLLSDILDESRKIMVERQISSPNTRVSGECCSIVADILGVSAIILTDLKHSRLSDYTFNWNEAVNPKGDTGVRLQYTHCRLCSLKDTSGISATSFCEPKALTEPVANELVFQIAKFDDIITQSFETLEASVLASYLFNLCNVINKALLSLRVKGEPELGPQRLLLFEKARLILHQGMVILGLTPLTKM